ncbi:DUF4097 family beta strand repeat-containing protein [Lutispora sp.]|uniref:DUF4097 family beta strand repeat-containing protein n=1 Tax=Lutispora sp. TaxID=2828727 RepID=UPI003563790C
MRKKKIGTITLAIGLITAGSVMFAQNFTDLPIKDVYKYWPLLLIGLGLEIVIYMSIYGRNDENVRFSIDGLCIVFIILAAIFANSSFIGFRHINIRGIGDIPFIGNLNYRGKIEEKITKDGISKDYDIKELKLTNSFGDIEIRKGNSNEIRLEANVTVQYNDENKARNYIKDAIRIEEGQITNIYIDKISSNRSRDYEKAMVDFIVYIPEGITVDIENSFGDIDVESAGKTTVKNSHGDIKLVDCSKDVEVENSFGRIEMENIGGNIDASSSNGDIRIEDVAGSIDTETSFGNIRINNVKGNVVAESRNGNVKIAGVEGNVDVETSFGNVEIDEESAENGRVYAETSFGSIKGFKDDVRDSGQKKYLETKLGNGSKEIRLKTSNGNIEMK